MLKSEITPRADRIGAVGPNLAASSEGPLTAARQSQRAIAPDDRNGPAQTTRFVAGGRAILLLSLACWAALIGAAYLLFG